MGKPVMAKSQQWLWVLLLLWLLKPGMADMWMCWWRLRHWRGEIYFVHPGGWHEPLSAWHAAAIEELFLQEPEMAEYVAAQSQMPELGLTPYPPTWHVPSLSWVISRTREDANWKRVWVARPINLEKYGPPVAPPAASDSFTGSEAMRATGMGWVLGNEARDGSRRDPDPDPYADLARDGSGGASSSSRPRSPSRPRSFVWERQARDGSAQANDGPAQANDGSAKASDGCQRGPSPVPPITPTGT